MERYTVSIAYRDPNRPDKGLQHYNTGVVARSSESALKEVESMSILNSEYEIVGIVAYK